MPRKPPDPRLPDGTIQIPVLLRTRLVKNLDVVARDLEYLLQSLDRVEADLRTLDSQLEPIEDNLVAALLRRDIAAILGEDLFPARRPIKGLHFNLDHLTVPRPPLDRKKKP